MKIAPSMALAARSLRLDTRSPFIHLLRSLLGALMLLALLYAWSTAAQVGAAGLNLYTAVIRIDFFFVSILGIALFATSITEERREGSLGLMRMAGLNSIGVLMGTSVSQLTVALSLLAVQLPFTLFAETLGGVKNVQIFAGFVNLGCYLLFAYGVGLVASTLCRTGAVASRWTLGALVVANIWPVLWDVLQAVLGFVGILPGRVTLPDAFDQLTCWGALEATLGSGFVGPMFGRAAALHLFAALALFLWAWVSFDFVERQAGRESTHRSWLGWDPWGGLQRVPRFSGNALVWKDYRLFVGGRRGIVLRFALYGAATLVLAWSNNPFSSNQSIRHDFGHSVLLLVAAGVVLDLGSLAGRVFRDEIAWQTYSTLLLLPKSVLQLSYGKVMGCLVAVFPALVFLLIGMLYSAAETLLFLGPLVFCYIALLYMLLPLIAYISLWLPRGAFPLTMFGFAVVGAGVYFTTRGSEVATCCAGLLLFIAAWRLGAKLHERIIDRLGELSGVDV